MSKERMNRIDSDKLHACEVVDDAISMVCGAIAAHKALNPRLIRLPQKESSTCMCLIDTLIMLCAGVSVGTGLTTADIMSLSRTMKDNILRDTSSADRD